MLQYKERLRLADMRVRPQYPNNSLTVRLLYIIASAPLLCAHDVITTKLTYARDIQPILARRCLSCHALSQQIPLTRYEEVRPWAVSIKEQVLSRKMPPWGAVKGFGPIFPDQALTEEETMLVAAWVVGGAPEGASGKAVAPTSTFLPQPSANNLQDIRIVTAGTLTHHLHVSALRARPNGLVESARIIATLPDGSVQPLVWLFHYDPKWNHDFWFRTPLDLPAGTRVSSDSPLQFSLLTVERFKDPLLR